MNGLKRLPAWLVSGLLLGLAWPGHEWLGVSVEAGWLAWFALVPVLLRLRRVQSFRAHVAATLPLFLLLPVLVCWWLSYFSAWAVPVVMLTQSVFLWVPLALHYPLQRRLGWRTALLLLPLTWTVWEWAWLGVSDFTLAVGNPLYTQARLLWLNQFVDLTGPWGLLAWVVGMNVALARVLDASAGWSVPKTARRLALTAGGWLVGPVLYSTLVLNVPSLVVDPRAPTVRVGLVQTNEDPYASVTDVSRGQRLQRLVALSSRTVQQTPDLVVAPEGAFPLPLLRDSALFAGLRHYVQYFGVPFATGLQSPVDSKHFYNEAFVFTPELSRIYGPLHLRPDDLEVYRKQHSLAFSEHTPALLRWADNWLRPGKASVRLGNAPVAFAFTDRPGNTRHLAIAICWEQMYPGTIAALTRQQRNARAADFLVFIMNDGWFYNSPGPRMLLAFSQLRAIENRRGIARCSNQGYSGYVDPFGRVVATLPRQQEATGQIAVAVHTKLTFFTKHPDWFPLACGGVLGLIILWRFRQPTRPATARRKARKTNVVAS